MQGGTLIVMLAGAAIMPQPQAIAPPAAVAPAISKAPLPRFPHLRWPGAFVPREAPVVQSLGHFRFWDGTTLQDVEGRTWLATLVARNRGAGFDETLLRRAVEADLARLGGVRLAAGRVPAALLDTINDADRKALAPGLGDVRNGDTQSWVIRRANRQIWVQYTGNATQASVAVVATLPD